MYFHVCKKIIKKILRYSKHRYYYSFSVIEYGNILKILRFRQFARFMDVTMDVNGKVAFSKFCKNFEKCKVDSSSKLHSECIYYLALQQVLLDFSLTVKAAPHECVIRTGQP